MPTLPTEERESHLGTNQRAGRLEQRVRLERLVPLEQLEPQRLLLLLLQVLPLRVQMALALRLLSLEVLLLSVQGLPQAIRLSDRAPGDPGEGDHDGQRTREAQQVSVSHSAPS